MNNDITKLLDLKDSNIEIKSIIVRGNVKEITLEKMPTAHYCPLCNFKMHSLGVYTRAANHPILQDGYVIKLIVKQRRWRCSNDQCRYIITDRFSFLDKRKRNTNVTDFLIVQAFKDVELSAAQIARRFNVSDTYAIYTFERYVDMKRRQLTAAICIDEVQLKIPKVCNYALVIQDFATGEPIDLVINRRKEITEPYFASIPRNERAKVKYLVTDMYQPYLNYVDIYFPNAVSVVDSFHVVKMINGKIQEYIRRIIRKLNEKDEARHARLEQELGRRIGFVHSREYYIVKEFQWLILKNRSDIKYSSKAHFDHKFNCYMSVYDYEYELFKIDSNLAVFRDLKERYISFNNKYVGNHKAAASGLNEIIQIYRDSGFKMFEDIADSLQTHRERIINSCIMIERIDKAGNHLRRLSNGPMESLNRIPKDMKRHARGYGNFYHIRNRFLFSQRKNAAILAAPKPWKDVYFSTGKVRGPYRKNAKKGPRLK